MAEVDRSGDQKMLASRTFHAGARGEARLERLPCKLRGVSLALNWRWTTGVALPTDSQFARFAAIYGIGRWWRACLDWGTGKR